jgi:hypothetical protein
MRGLSAFPRSDEDYEGSDKERAEEAAWDIACTIVDTPATGVAGLAIKAYLCLRADDDYFHQDHAALSGRLPDYPWPRFIASLQRGMLKDMVRLAPELAPLAVKALKEPDEDGVEVEEKRADPHDEVLRRAETLLPLYQTNRPSRR